MLRSLIPFANARTAFKALLCGLDFSVNDTILLPAYIGWSKNEGSGVFDPVQETGTRFAFYRVTCNLATDLDDLASKLASFRPRLVVLIHYFGFPDPNLLQAVRVCREHGALILEDEAHALYSDWIGGVCGRFGDAAILSLHKMLPFESGGLLVLNDSFDANTVERLKNSPLRCDLRQSPLDYDLLGISTARRRNADTLLALVSPLAGKVDLLYSRIPAGVVPQTLPVIIASKSRDELYFSMNESGFGVVSLYHTLIDQIQQPEFPVSHWLARRILNLPVHQDIQPGQLAAMIACLGRLLE